MSSKIYLNTDEQGGGTTVFLVFPDCLPGSRYPASREVMHREKSKRLAALSLGLSNASMDGQEREERPWQMARHQMVDQEMELEDTSNDDYPRIKNIKKIFDQSPNNKSFGVNIMAHFHLLKAFLPTLIELKNGYIVTVASILGTFGVCQASDYCTSKAAVLSLHESLELDCRFLNILIPTVSFFIE
ncbi:uncharacterized protein MELLADRAFT_103569 [Melampsora larici-populina 98AG31]|uniref:Uncharacterized protein n=1 Tax=Melampsora larici-populina (strain 98AG31 / pathotype 3-4-7) TaxID=747676 RepID=F4RBS2_MELLP|nr:uncharacterized protein MELLADRAFT_103569 [Melampsora larici-populina 98AG31]EGG10288.1 hypothetical protein MELLADRAFT_103569 [Melampsora larici-populina 98AG31]